MSTPYLVGVSGKIGSGKNFFANSLTKSLTEKGYKVKEASFATPLKAQASEIIEDLKTCIDVTAQKFLEQIITLAQKHEMKIEQMLTLFSFVKEEIKENAKLNGYTRTEGVRRLLQYLGTNIRREQNPTYWTDRFKDSLPTDCDFVFVTDVRFPNEADCILSYNSTLARVEVPREVILERVKSRDGLQYSEEATAHTSENALDDYPRFSIVVGSTFDAEAIVSQILKGL